MTSHTTHSFSFNIGDVGVSIAVSRALSELELTSVKHLTIEGAERCRATRMSNELCALAILEESLALVKSFDAVDVGEITAKVGETTMSKELVTAVDRAGEADGALSDWDELEFHSRAISHGGWVVVELAGELDVLHAGEVRTTLVGLDLARRAGLALDLRKLSFMDSTGVRLVLQAMQRAERHGADFVVVRGRDSVHRILELVGLTEQLRIVDDLGFLS